MSFHTWHHQGPRDPSSCTTFIVNPHWVRPATGKQSNKQTNKQTNFHLCTLSHFGCIQLFVTLWTVGFQASLSGGFSRQEYWNILPITSCHTLLEHYIWCCPSHQLPWEPKGRGFWGGDRTPATQEAESPLQQALTGTYPSLPGQPQEQIPVDGPPAEVEIKPQFKPWQCGQGRRLKTFPPAVQDED